MPELFHHQDTFFGSLAVWRAAEGLVVSTRGLELGFNERCPALDAASRCSLHHDKKPAVCSVVPLEARRPDHEQAAVLAERAIDAERFGSDCITAGARPGFDVLTRRLAVVHEPARRALALRRADIAADRQFWGDALCAELEAARVAPPPHGFLSLSLAPVLLRLAQLSARVHARCVDYVTAQLALAARLLSEARDAGHGEHASSRQLAAFAGTHARLLLALRSAPHSHFPTHAPAVERWLGLVTPGK